MAERGTRLDKRSKIKKPPKRFDDSSLQTQWLHLAIPRPLHRYFQVKSHFLIQENFEKQRKFYLTLVSQKWNYGGVKQKSVCVESLEVVNWRNLILKLYFFYHNAFLFSYKIP